MPKKTEKRPKEKVLRIYLRSSDDFEKLTSEITVKYQFMGYSKLKKKFAIEADVVNKYIIIKLIKDLELEEVNLVEEIKSNKE